jgi:hypothetical protein
VERLGFPWILSPESIILNGLRWIFAERNFSRPFAARRAAPNGRRHSRRAEVQNFSWNLFSSVSGFQQYNSVEVFSFRRAADGRVSSECAA